jgi:hypothetical protein
VPEEPVNMLFTECLKQGFDHHIEITEVGHYIHEQAFAEIAAYMIHQMIGER